MSKVNLVPVTGAQNVSAINDNFEKVAEALNDKVLYRDNPRNEPNQMGNDMDMNGKRIYNLPEPIFDHEPVRKKEMGDVKKSLRVSDRELPPLPSAAARRNKIVSFDNNGNPEVRFPSADSATKLRQDLTAFTGTISADAEWSDVPAHSDPAFDVQTQALVNRTEIIKSAVLSYPDFAAASAAAATLPDGQIVEVLDSRIAYTVIGGALTAPWHVVDWVDGAKFATANDAQDFAQGRPVNYHRAVPTGDAYGGYGSVYGVNKYRSALESRIQIGSLNAAGRASRWTEVPDPIKVYAKISKATRVGDPAAWDQVFLYVFNQRRWYGFWCCRYKLGSIPRWIR